MLQVNPYNFQTVRMQFNAMDQPRRKAGCQWYVLPRRFSSYSLYMMQVPVTAQQLCGPSKAEKNCVTL
jgi:hypothetical protein